MIRWNSFIKWVWNKSKKEQWSDGLPTHRFRVQNQYGNPWPTEPLSFQDWFKDFKLLGSRWVINTLFSCNGSGALTFKRQPQKMVKHTDKIRPQQPMNCFSVFEHFEGLALKALGLSSSIIKKEPQIVYFFLKRA